MDNGLKPWEISISDGGGASSTSPGYIPNTDNSSGAQSGKLHSSSIPFSNSGGSGSVSKDAILNSGNVNPNLSSQQQPQLPPRPGQSNNLSGPNYSRPPIASYPGNMYGYGGAGAYGYGGGYSSPYMSPYGNSMMYGGMGRMYGAGPMMPGPNGEPSFSQLAEESSAAAFQSIESFVSAFGSISAMLESTFHAVYSSFRAVVGVADHLGRVKQVLSTLAIFRFFRWIIRRFLYLVGISKINPAQAESVWNSLSAGVGANGLPDELTPGGNRPSSWPILMFLGFIMAGPYLMWKLIASLNLTKSPKDTRWASGETEHFVARTEFDFLTPASDRELAIKKGQIIRLAPASQQPVGIEGWVLASDGNKIGLVPINYIKVAGKRSGNPVPEVPRPNLMIRESQEPTVLRNDSNPASTNAELSLPITNNNTTAVHQNNEHEAPSSMSAPVEAPTVDLNTVGRLNERPTSNGPEIESTVLNASAPITSDHTYSKVQDTSKFSTRAFPPPPKRRPYPKLNPAPSTSKEELSKIDEGVV